MHRLMDALAVLLVRLHLAGFAWGDCSLSNTLFRRDAGAFAAYLVDAETGELHPELTRGQRSTTWTWRGSTSAASCSTWRRPARCTLRRPDRLRHGDLRPLRGAVEGADPHLGVPGGQAPPHRAPYPPPERTRLRRGRDADRARLQRRHGDLRAEGRGRRAPPAPAAAADRSGHRGEPGQAAAERPGELDGHPGRLRPGRPLGARRGARPPLGARGVPAHRAVRAAGAARADGPRADLPRAAGAPLVPVERAQHDIGLETAVEDYIQRVLPKRREPLRPTEE